MCRHEVYSQLAAHAGTQAQFATTHALDQLGAVFLVLIVVVTDLRDLQREWPRSNQLPGWLDT